MPADLSARVLLIGAGGHARVCLEALLDRPGCMVVGAVSRDGLGVANLGVPMVGADDDLDQVARYADADSALVAIGDNVTRAAVAARWLATGRTLVTAISRFAMPSTSADLADGVVLLAGSVVNAATVIGTGSIVNTGATVDHDCIVGEFVHIAPGVAIGGGASIGERAFLGIGSRVLPGVRIGADVTVGAGAVVTRDVDAGMVVVGVPARPIERRR